MRKFTEDFFHIFQIFPPQNFIIFLISNLLRIYNE